MLRWFHALMPREERFFDLFARHADAIVAGAKALRDMLEGGDAVPRGVARHADAVAARVAAAGARSARAPAAQIPHFGSGAVGSDEGRVKLGVAAVGGGFVGGAVGFGLDDAEDGLRTGIAAVVHEIRGAGPWHWHEKVQREKGTVSSISGRRPQSVKHTCKV